MKSTLVIVSLALAAGLVQAQDNGIESPEWKAALTVSRAVSAQAAQPADTRQAPVDKYEFLYKHSPL